MKPVTKIINSESSAESLSAEIIPLFDQHKYFRVKIYFARDRSLDQNALWFAMYERISETIGLGTAADIAYWRGFCKLTFGVPILLRDSESFSDGWQRLVLDNPNYQTWESQIELMTDRVLFPATQGFPVTSLLDKTQGVEYTNELIFYFASLGVSFEDLLK